MLYIDEEREASDDQAQQKMKNALSGLVKCGVRVRYLSCARNANFPGKFNGLFGCLF